MNYFYDCDFGHKFWTAIFAGLKKNEFRLSYCSKSPTQDFTFLDLAVNKIRGNLLAPAQSCKHSRKSPSARFLTKLIYLIIFRGCLKQCRHDLKQSLSQTVWTTFRCFITLWCGCTTDPAGLLRQKQSMLRCEKLEISPISAISWGPKFFPPYMPITVAYSGQSRSKFIHLLVWFFLHGKKQD